MTLKAKHFDVGRSQRPEAVVAFFKSANLDRSQLLFQEAGQISDGNVRINLLYDDVLRPELGSSSPKHMATNVPINSSIVIVMTKEVADVSGKVTVVRDGTTLTEGVDYTISPDGSWPSNRFTISNAIDGTYLANYDVLLSSSIADSDGNTMARGAAISFMTQSAGAMGGYWLKFTDGIYYDGHVRGYDSGHTNYWNIDVGSLADTVTFQTSSGNTSGLRFLVNAGDLTIDAKANVVVKFNGITVAKAASSSISEYTAASDTDGADLYIRGQSGGAHVSNNPRGGDIHVVLGLAGSGGTGRDGILYVDGDVDITGKLTVSGLIDPTGIVINEQASCPWTAQAGYGAFWVYNDSPSIPMFTDDDGTSFQLLGVAAGLDQGGVVFAGPSNMIGTDGGNFYWDDTNHRLVIGGTQLTNEGDVQLLGDGVLALAETTTPAADTNYGKIYCKSDNKLYFQDGAGVEHTIAFV